MTDVASKLCDVWQHLQFLCNVCDGDSEEFRHSCSKLIFFYSSGKPSFPSKFVSPCAYTPLPPAVRQRGTWRPFPCPLPSIWEIPSSLSDHTLSQSIPESAVPTTKKSPTHHICWRTNTTVQLQSAKKINRTQLSILSVSHNIIYMRVSCVASCLQPLFYFAAQENPSAKLDWLKPSFAWHEGTTGIVSSEAKVNEEECCCCFARDKYHRETTHTDSTYIIVGLENKEMKICGYFHPIIKPDDSYASTIWLI